MLTQKNLSREARGDAIAQNGLIERNTQNSFIVHSQTSNKEYSVAVVGGVWSCTCPDHTYRHVECKHIHAVAELLSEGVE